MVTGYKLQVTVLYIVLSLVTCNVSLLVFGYVLRVTGYGLQFFILFCHL